jgi:hypothetical protein
MGLSSAAKNVTASTTTSAVVKSPGGKVLLRSFNTLHRTPLVSREAARAPFDDSHCLAQNNLAASSTTTTHLHQLPHKEIRRPKTTASARTQPLIELARIMFLSYILFF